MFWSAVTGLVVLTAVIPFHFVAPTAMQLTMSVAQGVFSSVRQWLVILSLRFKPVSTLAPYSYMSLLWMTGAGFLVFGVFPELSTLVGAGVIVASGLYSANRERRRSPFTPRRQGPSAAPRRTWQDPPQCRRRPGCSD